jgi:hypothetical protein
VAVAHVPRRAALNNNVEWLNISLSLYLISLGAQAQYAHIRVRTGATYDMLACMFSLRDARRASERHDFLCVWERLT